MILDDRSQCCLALSLVEISPAAWRKLVEFFGSEEAALEARDVELELCKGISSSVRDRVRSAAKRLDSLDTDIRLLEEVGAQPISIYDPRYPLLLKEIVNPPILLYVRGELTDADRFSIAIVGSRHPRVYGIHMAEKLSSDLARAGLTIISGGAAGIDAAAHEAALHAGGRTVAVVGCGLDIVYPADHASLFERISEHGAVISEYPLKAPPEAWRFPRRNRIISGLSRGVIVCDAPENSGSLITASCAAEQGRDIFAVPGNVDGGHNRGAHKLLKDGAKLVEGAEDVLSEYGLNDSTDDHKPSPLPKVEVSPEEEAILAMLDLDPLPMDTIIDQSGMSTADVSVLLTFLEMKRLVKRVAGPAYVRVLT